MIRTQGQDCFCLLAAGGSACWTSTACKAESKGGHIMGKYLYLWEIDRTKIPLDPKERGVGFSMLLEMVKQDIKKGITKDWGVFPGEFNGYSVVEGTEVEIMNQVQQYTPFVYFKVCPIASVAQVEEMIKAMTK
jgi:hypothetical protein